jgi:uncharacterized protein YecE (DUF72 family)
MIDMIEGKDNRITVVYLTCSHDLDWHLWLQLPGMEGQLLSARSAGAKMLPYYAARFPTVEINYTFYRMPNEAQLARWAAADAEPYRLTLKAPRRITHDSRLKNCEDLVAAFCRVAGTLQDKLGTLLFQLPPNAKQDLRLFEAFLDMLPPRVRRRSKFRHVSWFTEDLFACFVGVTSRCVWPTVRSCRRPSR